VINTDGTYTYTPNPGFSGTDTIVVTICDGGLPLPGICVNDTIFVTVTSCLSSSNSDCDGDGVTNGTETTDGTNPNDPCNYLPGSISLSQGAAWNAADCDGDGVTNGTETTDGTNPNDPCDYDAGNITLTQGGAWNAADCDGDGVTNGTETTDGTNPNDPCNYLPGSITLSQGGDWNGADCDGDGITNGDEVAGGSDPNDACSPKSCGLFIPKGFSPNDDGINDVVVIKGIENFPENEIKIFNRWGNLVYEAQRYDNVSVVWDGTTTVNAVGGSERLPEATYFYILTYKDLSGNTQKVTGYIYLNRNGQ
jgi:gliding motility-associated-like protein